MKTHVFLGAGPANLHRALKIAQNDPNAHIIIIDPRLDRETLNFDRETGRSNVFFFDKTTSDSIKELLWTSNIPQKEIDASFSTRDFGVNKAVPGKFFMTQIRDLQILMINGLKNLFSSRKDRLTIIQDKVDMEGNIRDNVLSFLKTKNGLTFPADAEVEIHLATGALRDSKEGILYPVKSKSPHSEVSQDIEAMTVVPKHATGTFNPQNMGLFSTEDLSRYLIGLQENPIWKNRLKEFHWTLLRPPSVRIFYVADILYIGAEIPPGLRKEETSRYLKTLLSLSFPSLNIDKLKEDTAQLAQFDVARGEHGQFQDVKRDFTTIHRHGDARYLPHYQTAKGDFTTIHRHGDARYLPHYQTASGFVLAMAQNDLYVEIERQDTFLKLYTFAVNKGLIASDKKMGEIHKRYEKLLDKDDRKIVKAFKAELMNAGIRDLLDSNKKKVGLYFMDLHRQELEALTKTNQLKDLLSIYNEAHGTQLELDSFKDIDHRVLAVRLLKSNNIAFLKSVLPLLINVDMKEMSDQKIYDLRDTHIGHYEKIISEANIDANEDLQRFLSLAHEDVDDLLAVMKKIASNLDANKALHRRASMTFFKGANSDLIRKFKKEIFQLDQASTKKEPMTLKKELLDVYRNFHHNLQKNRSKRTIRELNESLDSAITSLNAQINRKTF